MRLGMGLVATMTALLLGLVTASARSSFDSQDAAMRTNAASILTLDRLLARYGPETRADERPDPHVRRLPDRKHLARRWIGRLGTHANSNAAGHRASREPDPPAVARDRRAAVVQGRGAEAERRSLEVALAHPEQPGWIGSARIPRRRDLLAGGHVYELRPLRPVQRFGPGGTVRRCGIGRGSGVPDPRARRPVRWAHQDFELPDAFYAVPARSVTRPGGFVT